MERQNNSLSKAVGGMLSANDDDFLAGYLVASIWTTKSWNINLPSLVIDLKYFCNLTSYQTKLIQISAYPSESEYSHPIPNTITAP